MPRAKSSKKGTAEVKISPSPSCEKCKCVLPKTTSRAAHPMYGRCTVDNDSEHFTMGYSSVNCTACATLPRSAYRNLSPKGWPLPWERSVGINKHHPDGQGSAIQGCVNCLSTSSASIAIAALLQQSPKKTCFNSEHAARSPVKAHVQHVLNSVFIARECILTLANYYMKNCLKRTYTISFITKTQG